VAYKEWPVFEYLNSNYGAILGDLRDERRVVYRVPQSIFFSFYRKGIIGIWYCNLRNSVKATSLGHPRYTEARLQYKASNVFFQHFNRQASRDHLAPEARRLEGASPIKKNNKNNNNKLGHILSYQHPDWE
jgi:hypothetical protein